MNLKQPLARKEIKCEKLYLSIFKKKCLFSVLSLQGTSGKNVH